MSNDVYPTTYLPVRVTNGQIYDQIDQDLTDALTKFAAAGATPISLYANKNLAIALQARAHALRGDYVNALTYADQWITTSGLNLASFAN